MGFVRNSVSLWLTLLSLTAFQRAGAAPPTTPQRCVDRGAGACGKACEGGDGHACTSLAMMIDVGLDAERTRSAIPALLARACSLGHPGGCFLQAKRAGRDVSASLKLFESGCERGDVLACRSLGILRSNALAESGKLDDRGALQAFRKACPGDPESCVRAAMLCPRNPKDCSDEEPATLHRAAEKGLSTACEGGDSASCAVLGRLLLTSPGLKTDVERGIALMSRGCSLGSCGFLRATARRELGPMPVGSLMGAKVALAKLGATVETCQARRADLVRRCFTEDRLGFMPPVCTELGTELSQPSLHCPTEPDAPSDEPPLARVNGRVLSLAAFRRAFAFDSRAVRDQGGGPDFLRMLGIGGRVLDGQIDVELLAQAAAARGLTVSDAELTEALRTRAPGADDAQVRREVLAAKLAREVVDPVTLTRAELPKKKSEVPAALASRREQTLRAFIDSLRQAAKIEIDQSLLDAAQND
jgi:hypothetical protein